MERRRCNHHELEEPLSTLECLSSVIDPKRSGTNKNRYVVASQQEEARRYCRGLKGVPLVYVKRSVMVMEPMSDGSVSVRESAEKEKFRQGLRGRVAGLGKRKRDDESIERASGTDVVEGKVVFPGKETSIKKRRARGHKGPNPLSVKKPKNDLKTTEVELEAESQGARRPEQINVVEDAVYVDAVPSGEAKDSHPLKPKKKRRRQKHKGLDAMQPAEDIGNENLA